MELIAGEESLYGYRKLTRCLQRQYGLIINKSFHTILERDLLEPT